MLTGTGNSHYARFVNIAEASLAETEYLLILSRDLGYVEVAIDQVFAEITEISKMLFKLHSRISQDHKPE